MEDYWNNFSLTTKRLYEKFKIRVPWGIEYLNSKQLRSKLEDNLYLMKLRMIQAMQESSKN